MELNNIGLVPREKQYKNVLERWGCKKSKHINIISIFEEFSSLF